MGGQFRTVPTAGLAPLNGRDRTTDRASALMVENAAFPGKRCVARRSAAG